jgi:hypothetical protein
MDVGRSPGEATPLGKIGSVATGQSAPREIGGPFGEKMMPRNAVLRSMEPGEGWGAAMVGECGVEAGNLERRDLDRPDRSREPVIARSITEALDAGGT